MMWALFVACQQKPAELTDEQNNETAPDAVELSENQVLYNEVMKIHDEAMARMDEMYRIKRELQQQIKQDPALTAEKRNAMEKRIVELDSASESMMAWMRTFKPLPDTADEEEAKKYLDSEMVRVKKVRERILRALNEPAE